MHLTYDIHKTYQENYDAGPSLERPQSACPEVPLKRFLGRQVRSRLGIAAGLLLNSRWIEAYSDLGFDLLTYKTVRSSYRPCYPLPNWVFVSDDGQLDGPIYFREFPPDDVSAVTSSVCFGMPSMSPDVWRRDVAVAKENLRDGQLLIVSVVGTPEAGWGVEEIANDFAKCAAWAVDSGADIVEANLSCPNVCTAEGSIYLDPDLSRSVAATVRAQIGTMPLLLKVGYFGAEPLMRAFLNAVSASVDGVTMVNGLTRPVLFSDQRPVFGPDYVRAGVLGRSIHGASVRSVEMAKAIIARDGLDLSLLAVGGASLVADIEDFFRVGADAVLMGSSPMYCPSLAREAKTYCPEW